MPNERPRIQLKNQYFAVESDIEYIPTGSTLLDCVLGGGYPVGRMVNIVGDKSTGKTLLAMEGVANFLRKYKTGAVVYNETESAFDPNYAKALGVPLDKMQMKSGCETVEDLFYDLDHFVKRCSKEGVTGLYVVDSLDALSDRVEIERDISESSYGASKAKILSQLFRRQVRTIEESRVCLMIISQVRDNIGVTFGQKYSRSGGRALDFYASQIVYLAHKQKLKAVRKGVTRAIGVVVRAQCTKNKVGLPFRECEFAIRFGWGIDDVRSCREFLKTIKYDSSIPDDAAELRRLVKNCWVELDNLFLPEGGGKYAIDVLEDQA